VAHAVKTIESARDRRELVRDAGFWPVSVASVLVGVSSAFGTFVLLSGLVAAVADWAGADADYLARDWRTVGDGVAVAVIAITLVSFAVGGYAAGRASRRLGMIHGVIVFAGGVIVAGLSVWFAQRVTDSDRIVTSLRDLGVPGTRGEWRDVGSLIGIGSLAAAFLGATGGGVVGERWHRRLLERALDPAYGPEAVVRARARRELVVADERHDEAEQRVALATGSTAPDDEPAVATEVSEPGDAAPAPAAADAPKIEERTVDGDAEVVERDQAAAAEAPAVEDVQRSSSEHRV
jgi:hypothetical protein